MYLVYKNKSFKNAPDISVDSLVSMREKGEKHILVDVREKKEIEVSTIPFAITKKEFENNFSKYKDQKIIIYCTIGYRSGIYTKKLQEKKLNAFNLVGGVLSWAHAQQEFVSSSGSLNIVHVYGKRWDLVPEEFQSVW
jgi:rhodanese-related sulfurtransferase